MSEIDELDLVAGLMRDERRGVIYRPQLNSVVGKATATILLQQIFFRWDNHNREPFYKFKEPCSHDLYKPGDSWIEELCFSKHEFDTALAKIAVKKNSKMTLEAAMELAEKEDKPVIYWTNIGRVTYYTVHPQVMLRIFKKAYQSSPVNPESGFTKTRKADLRKPEKSLLVNPENGHIITKITKDEPQNDGGDVSPVDQDALAALLEIGVTPDQAEKWAAVFEPEDVIGWCEYAKVTAGITNPPGLVIAMLRDGAPPPPRFGVKPEPEPVPRSPPQAEPPEPIPISGTDLDAREVWSHVLEELRMQMTQATFDTWLSGSEVVDGGNGTITVRVRDGYAVDWLSERWIKPIQRTLAGVVGQGMGVEFVAGEV